MKIRALQLICLVVIIAGSAGAQTLTGTVRDSASGRPLHNAVVVLGGRQASTDTLGRFVMSGLIPGRWRLAIRSLGYAPVDSMLNLESYDTTQVQLSLTRLGPLLDTVHVSAERVDVPGKITEFETRRMKKLGRYITAEEMRKNDDRALPDVMRSKLGGLGFEVGERQTWLYNPAQQPPGSLKQGSGVRRCYVQVVLDGINIYQMDDKAVTMFTEPPDMAQLLTRNFDGVEYYSSPSRTPPELRTPGAICGTLVLWSRRK